MDLGCIRRTLMLTPCLFDQMLSAFEPKAVRCGIKRDPDRLQFAVLPLSMSTPSPRSLPAYILRPVTTGKLRLPYEPKCYAFTSTYQTRRSDRFPDFGVSRKSSHLDQQQALMGCGHCPTSELTTACILHHSDSSRLANTTTRLRVAVALKCWAAKGVLLNSSWGANVATRGVTVTEVENPANYL